MVWYVNTIIAVHESALQPIKCCCFVFRFCITISIIFPESFILLLFMDSSFEYEILLQMFCYVGEEVGII